MVICLVFISCFIYGIFLYNNIQESKTAGFDNTKQRVVEETELTNIRSVSRFHGKVAYHIVFGSTEDNEEKILFVPIKSDSEEITIIDTSDIISKKSIKDQWQNQCENCELIEITPAMENGKPLWEITYKDSADRYILDYLSLYDGTRYQQLRLKSMFN